MPDRALMHDWNHHGPHADGAFQVRLHDETLRDGLQSPSVTDPCLDDKLEILRGLDRLGVDTADVGLPGAGERARTEIEALVRLTAEEGLTVRPTVACRTHEADIRPAVEIAQRTGVPLEAMMFLGTSPIRLYAEGWDEARLERLTRDAMRMAVQGGLGATFVTEDTVRSHPETLRRLFCAAIEEGATCLILCDTVGHATPAGTRNLVRWTRDLLQELGVADRVSIDWHGHDDRGLSLINTLAAAEAGAQRLHGSILGIGERVGNTALDQVMVNLKLLGLDHRDLSGLHALARLVSRATGTPIPPNYPVLGDDAFRTATGVHAAAVIKASRMGDLDLADRVYSGVPARWVGREQEIAIGFMSGASNVRWWLERHGIEPVDQAVDAVLSYAKQTTRLLTDDEIVAVAAQAVAP
jgi:2-isopropylmalate synthase